MARTKILVTIGPASEDKIQELIKAGVDGIRLNMAHISPEIYKKFSSLIKDARKLKEDLFVVADLEGPKIRLGEFTPLNVHAKEEITLTCSETKSGIPVKLPDFYKYVKKGDKLIIDDGNVELSVMSLNGKEIKCRVEYGETINPRKGITVLGRSIPIPYLTPKMKSDLDFIMENEVDYVSISFTRNVKDVKAVEQLIAKTNVKKIGKIENIEGENNTSEILKEVDAMMVARGDYGVELGVFAVPTHQKDLIEKCNIHGRTVITATQMIESMMTSRRPKRSEVSDIFNAVLDGTDAVMLSGETSKGLYPVETVETMNKVLEEAEKYLLSPKRYASLSEKMEKMIKTDNMVDTISKAVYSASKSPFVKAILVPTSGGYTARMIARFRPEKPIIAITDSKMVLRQINAVWGITPVLVDSLTETNTVEKSLAAVKKSGHIKSGDTVIITAGLGKSGSGSTNVMRIEKVI